VRSYVRGRAKPASRQGALLLLSSAAATCSFMVCGTPWPPCLLNASLRSLVACLSSAAAIAFCASPTWVAQGIGTEVPEGAGDDCAVEVGGGGSAVGAVALFSSSAVFG